MTATSAPVAGRREWIGLIALALPCLLSLMDLTGLNLAAQRSNLTGAAVLAASQAAFVDGLHLAVICGAVVVFGLAVATVLWLGGAQAGTPPGPEPERAPSFACEAGA